MSNRPNIFTNKDANAKSSQNIAFSQKKIFILFIKDFFKVIISMKIVTLNNVFSNTQIFRYYFINGIKDLYIYLTLDFK